MLIKKALIIFFVTASLNLLSQVRIDSLLKILDQRLIQRKDSVQIIIHKFVDYNWKWSVLAIYQDTTGNWHGKYFTTKTNRNFKEVHRNYELKPKSVWPKAIQAFYQLGIDTIPQQGNYANGRDGTTYTFTYVSLNEKRESSYWCPNKFKRKHKNDKRATQIIKIRRKYFKKERIKN